MSKNHNSHDILYKTNTCILLNVNVVMNNLTKYNTFNVMYVVTVDTNQFTMWILIQSIQIT